MKYSIRTTMMLSDYEGRSVIEYQHWEPRENETVEEMINRVFRWQLQTKRYSDFIEIQILREDT